MPNNLKSIMVRNVDFKHPQLHGPEYSIEWEMSSYHACALRAELKAHYMSCNPYSSFTKVIGMKKMNNGNFEFEAIRNGTNSQGRLNDEPRVIDGSKQPLEDKAFLSGSKGTIKVDAYPVTDEYGNGTIRLLIDTIQVTYAIYSSGPDID